MTFCCLFSAFFSLQRKRKVFLLSNALNQLNSTWTFSCQCIKHGLSLRWPRSNCSFKPLFAQTALKDMRHSGLIRPDKPFLKHLHICEFVTVLVKWKQYQTQPSTKHTWSLKSTKKLLLFCWFGVIISLKILYLCKYNVRAGTWQISELLNDSIIPFIVIQTVHQRCKAMARKLLPFY